MSWKLLIAGICIFFIGGVLGTLITSNSLGNAEKGVQPGIGTSQTVDTTSSNYQAGFDAAKKLVEDSGLGSFFKTQDDVRSVSGTVTAIDGNRITVHDESARNPFDMNAISDRVIVVDANTKVNKFVLNSAETSKKTSQDARVSIVTAKVSDVTVGDSITVIADQNVKDLSEFTAQEIQILSRMNKN